MSELPVPRSEVNLRLRKIEENERDCVDIMIQLAAAKAALESVAGLVLRNYAGICSHKKRADVGADLARAVSIWIGGKA